jgi:hypothetical protein
MNYWKPYVNIRKRKMWIIIHGAKEHKAPSVKSVCVHGLWQNMILAYLSFLVVGCFTRDWMLFLVLDNNSRYTIP